MKSPTILLSESWLPKIDVGEFPPTPEMIKNWSAKSASYESETTRLLTWITAEHARHCAYVNNSANNWNYAWLLPFRAEFRRVIDKSEIARVLIFLGECPSELRPLGVWLLGQCADRFKLHYWRYFCGDPSPKVREHVARALERREAWHLLEAMSREFPNDPNVVRIYHKANDPIAKRPFAERMKLYARNVDDSLATAAAGPSQMPYWSRFTPWQGQPPKSMAFIRSILLHIRDLLRGNGAVR